MLESTLSRECKRRLARAGDGGVVPGDGVRDRSRYGAGAGNTLCAAMRGAGHDGSEIAVKTRRHARLRAATIGGKSQPKTPPGGMRALAPTGGCARANSAAAADCKRRFARHHCALAARFASTSCGPTHARNARFDARQGRLCIAFESPPRPQNPLREVALEATTNIDVTARQCRTATKQHRMGRGSWPRRSRFDSDAGAADRTRAGGQ